MKTSYQSAHKHSISGKPTTSAGGHSHELDAVTAALLALEARIVMLEGAPPVEPPPVEPPTPPPPPVSPPADLAAAIAATPVGGTLDATGGTYPGPITLNKAIVLRGAKITSGVTAGDWTTGTVRISAGATLDGCTIEGGFVGVTINAATGAKVLGCNIRKVVYAGVLTVSATDCLIKGNRITSVRPVSDANGYNSYGVTISSTSGPPSLRCIVEDNTIEDVPLWHGLDTHGGKDCIFRRNTVRACRRAVFLTSDPISVICDANDLTAPTAAEIAAAVAAYPAATPSAMARDVRGISIYGGSGRITGNVGHGYTAGAWWNPIKAGTYTTTGNIPVIP